MVLVGVVKRVYSYGVFIEFPNGLVGLAPLKYLSDEYITDTVGVYGDRQTVFAKVIILYTCSYYPYDKVALKWGQRPCTCTIYNFF